MYVSHLYKESPHRGHSLRRNIPYIRRVGNPLFDFSTGNSKVIPSRPRKSGDTHPNGWADAVLSAHSAWRPSWSTLVVRGMSQRAVRWLATSPSSSSSPWPHSPPIISASSVSRRCTNAMPLNGNPRPCNHARGGISFSYTKTPVRRPRCTLYPYTQSGIALRIHVSCTSGHIGKLTPMCTGVHPIGNA